ncbi:MAG: SET domain-containing protein-lysine N-methyltransferase [Bacteroidota bacterium]|nr:SET domain-containing protein-lysine N-methyltransferase [Bacteroidota bacterium]
MALLEKQLEIKESTIPGAGMGLFAKQFIQKGTRIVEYTGRIRTWKEVEYEDNNYYIFFVTEDLVIDASRSRKSLARFINDARGLQKVKGLNNNAQFVVDGFRVFVEAIKNIPAGTEIFLSYGKEYWQVIRTNLKIDAQSKI